MKLRTYTTFLLLLLWAIPSLASQLSLPSIFSDHMVLQHNHILPVWGKADPTTKISVSFAGQQKRTEADKNGNWRVSLEPVQASSEPRSLTITSKLGDEETEIKFTDVLVGEVWLCSGQSNMEWSMLRSENPKAAIAAADYPEIRLYHTPRRQSESPVEQIDADWKVCTPDTVKDFSAVAYYFGRKLHKDLDVPVGLLQSAWGGTRIEPWTPPSGFKRIESLKDIHQQVQKTLPSSSFYKKAMNGYLANMQQWSADAQTAVKNNSYVAAPPEFPQELILSGNHQTPTKLYNGMLHAHIPYAIRGAIWYQGESNHKEGMLYVDKTRALLNGWRNHWSYEFPFYFVQIAPYQYGDEASDILPIFWEANNEIIKTIPRTGMAIVNDHTTLNNIHPPNKEVPGTRLALLALANEYGIDVVSTGPTFKSLQVKDDSLLLTFDSAEGLTTRDGKSPDWFEIAGKDRVFEIADATISNNTITLRSDKVSKPLAVRFAWHKTATPNLMNGAGLPASTFRAGDLPLPPNPTAGKVPEADGFRMIYQIDIPSDANYSQTAPEYSLNNSSKDTASFSQIAYYLELEKTDGTQQSVFVSMDRFTDDLKKIGIPTHSTDAKFMQKVNNLTVRSHPSNAMDCTNSDGGNIEFWSGNYGRENQLKVPGAASNRYDFGDQANDKSPGYGCMQVHHWKKKQTVFAINHWGNDGRVDIGIGNAPSSDTDWTFKKNASDYTVRRLSVMVK